MSSSVNNAVIQKLLSDLSKLNTASLCDADKLSLVRSDSSYGGSGGLRLMEGLKPLNNVDKATIMVGIARTVQCTEPDDFLAVLQGLDEAQAGEVLVVNTLGSSTGKAVAGELFTAEAERKGVRGILVDGAMRDVAHLNEFTSVRCYSKSISPYSGTIQCLGRTQVEITCGGTTVCPNDVIVGDNDGIVVGPADLVSHILKTAQEIQRTEDAIKKRMLLENRSLHAMTNYTEHVKALATGKESSLTLTPNS